MIGLYFWAEALRKKREDEERKRLEVRIRRACKPCNGSGSIGRSGGLSGAYSFSMAACFNCGSFFTGVIYHMRGIRGLRDEAAKRESENL